MLRVPKMLVIKLYAGTVTEIVLSMGGFQVNSVTGVAVVKELSLKAILPMHISITPTLDKEPGKRRAAV